MQPHAPIPTFSAFDMVPLGKVYGDQIKALCSILEERGQEATGTAKRVLDTQIELYRFMTRRLEAYEQTFEALSACHSFTGLWQIELDFYGKMMGDYAKGTQILIEFPAKVAAPAANVGAPKAASAAPQAAPRPAA